MANRPRHGNRLNPGTRDNELDKLGALGKARALGDKAREYIVEIEGCVRDARRLGATWKEVGEALGITAQAAAQRFGK